MSTTGVGAGVTTTGGFGVGVGAGVTTGGFGAGFGSSTGLPRDIAFAVLMLNATSVAAIIVVIFVNANKFVCVCCFIHNRSGKNYLDFNPAGTVEKFYSLKVIEAYYVSVKVLSLII